ncbi:uncharacterized protein LOC131251297 isoform X2 [Magnolia sinica]|uniref:uncharacterized protein LOC131251297 isoform X2 n=1 Tax=Magnolia sinica TaxID=86752 RepID=UPI0026586E5D|nr:uncharacterized protein LOC131251297 isoform X2 [Magnolia sinica]
METWEALDVDDSDLPSLLRHSSTLVACKRGTPNNHRQDQQPKRSVSSSSISLSCLQPCFKSPHNPCQTQPENPTTAEQRPSPDVDRAYHLIPGPAGSIQAAMRRRTTGIENCCPMPDYEEEDGDFKRNPWLCALDFIVQLLHFSSLSFIICLKTARLGLSTAPWDPLVQTTTQVQFFSGLDSKSPLPHSIKTSKSMDRVPQVVGIIKSCTPNGRGDLIVTLKDPTGTMDASIHRKVLAESKFASDISIGSVIILQQIFSKDSGPPKQCFPVFTVRCGPEESLGTGSGMAAVHIVMEGADGIGNVKVGREASDVEVKVNERCFGCSSGKDAVVEEPNHETSGRSVVKKPMLGASLPDWTDEQLSELFADCED